MEIDVADAALHRMFAESLSGSGRFARATMLGGMAAGFGQMLSYIDDMVPRDR